MSSWKAVSAIPSASAELLRSIVDSAFDGIVTIDERGTVQAFNRTAERMFGYDAQEVIGENVSLLMPEPYRGEHDGYLARYRRTGEARIIGRGREVLGRRSDGTTFPLDLAVTPFEAAGRRYFTGIMRDLTERRQGETWRAGEQRLRDVLDTMFAFVGLISCEGIVLEANRAPLDAAGLVTADVVGKVFAETPWWSHSVAVQEQVRSAVRRAATGETVRELFVARVAKGLLIDVDAVFSPLRDASGAIVQVVASGVDVTDRLRTEEELRDRLQQQEAVANLGVAALRARDLDELLQTTVETVSRVVDVELCKVLELLPGGESLLLRAGIGWQEGLVGHAVVGAGLDSQAGYTLRYGEPVIVDDLRTETRFTGPALLHDHGVVSGASVIIHGAEGPYGVLGVHTHAPHRFSPNDVHFLVGVANVLADFVRRALAEQRLRREQEFSEVLVESLPGIVVLFDRQGRLARWNRALERMSGYNATELATMPALDLIAAQDRAGVEEGIRTVFEEGQALTEAHLLARDGSMVASLLSGRRIVVNGEPHLLGVALDVSEQKRLESQLRHAQRLDAFGQLAGGVAHDFNNLLTVIMGCASLLVEGRQPEEPEASLVDQIRRAGERGASLTKQLLAFSRKAVLEPKVLSLTEVVTEAEKMLRRLIGEDVEFVTLFDAGLSHVRVDPALMGQVLMNLVVNARDAMPKGGRLTIETSNVTLDEHRADSVRAGSYVMLAVSDTGSGISPEVMERLFEPFFTTKAAGRGSGLGLAVVHGIVKQSGAHIEVHSEPGLGAAFKIYFPVVDAPTNGHGATSPVRHGASGGTETVLLVEDEDAVRRVIVRVLERHGYRVLVASGGEEALGIAETHGAPIHLLITDVVMPGLDGGEVASAIQARYPGIKVLYLSGYPDAAVVRHGILHEEVAFLSKPFAGPALAAKVRAVLDQVEE